MDNFLPDWNFENDFPIPKQKNSIAPENELSELLWKDGQVILQSQTHRKPVWNNNNNQTEIHKQSDKINNRDSRSNFLEDEETVSWIQYPLEDDPFEKDFSSAFFSGFPSFDPIEPNNRTEQSKPEQQQQQIRKEKNSQTPKIDNNMPPPKFKHCQESKLTGFSHRRESSVTTIGPSHCGSNQFTNTTTGLSNGSTLKRDDVFDGKEVCKKRKDDCETLDPNSTSCSGGSSGCSFGRTSKEAGSGFSGHNNKRKCLETEESESQSKSVQRSGSARRRRAAEVHNLSERRRRDRINEKMKALQELIPHCSKTDKASVLDEAIDYLKSLQLQLQVMWMGSGMAAAPMMFPAVQPYMSRIPMPRLPLLDQSATQIPGLVCQNPGFNPVNQYQNPMLNPALSEQFARYMGGFHQMQAASQPMNMFGFGGQTGGQQSQTCGPNKGVNGPNTGGSANDNLPSSS